MSSYNKSFEPVIGQSSPLFSPARWWMLVTLHWVENRKRYLLALPAIAGALFVWYSFILVMDRHEPLAISYQFSTYYVGLYLIGCLYGSMLFSELGHKARSIQYLSVPASQFEKLLCALFFGVLLFFIVYTLLFYLVDIPMVALSNRLIHTRSLHAYASSNNDYPIRVYNLITREGAPIPDQDFNAFLLIYFALQAAFILGSVYFVRYSFIKTIVSLLLLVVVYMLFIIKGIASGLPEGWHIGRSLFEWARWGGPDGGMEEVKLIRLSSWASNSFIFFIQYCFPFIFWSITYVRLKEKEV
jgi:hypothetical protein